MALINSLTTKPKLNISNIKSPFGSGSSIPKISAGAGSFINRSSTPIKPAKLFSGNQLAQIRTNVSVADNLSRHDSDINSIAGQLSEINAVMQDIGGALALDFANRIANQQQDNKALKAQASADRRSSAESNLEGSKKIGKGIGSGLTSVGKAATGLSFGGILNAAQLLGAGVAINALWPHMETMFDWTMENINKILLVGGGLLALNVIGGLGTLLKFGAFFLNPKVLAIMSIIGGAIAIQNFREKDFKLHPNAVNQKVKEKEKKLGRTVTEQELNDIINNKGVKTVPRDLAAGSGLLNAPGSGMGYSGELMFGMMLGEQTKRLFRHLFGKKNDLNSFKNRRNNNGELISSISQKPGINLIEMDLPPIRIPPKEKKVAMEETTTVNAISSINVLNPYMSKTPELHGIIG